MINKRVFLILSVILTISIFSSPAQALWLSGYEYRKEITIDHIKIGSDLSNFPLAVILSDTTNIIDGNDVKFTLADGSTKLDYEKEKYATDDAAYWVNIPSVSSGTDTTFYMYYGKSGDTNESTTAVWDTNYKAVWHLDHLSGSADDSTSNNNDGTEHIYPDSNMNYAGKIDGADYFDGNDYIDVGNDASLRIAGDLTIGAWIKTTHSSGYMHILVDNHSAGVNRDYDFMVVNGVLQFYYGNGTNSIAYSSGTYVNDGTWKHVVFVADYPKYYFYVNGNQVYSNTMNWDVEINGDEARMIGGHSWTEYFYGTIDEVRLSDTARSADWIKASYYSGNDDLLSFSSEQQEGQELIPEPTSLLLLGFGVFGVAVFRRRLA